MERQKAKGCGTRIKETAENRIITNNAPSTILYRQQRTGSLNIANHRKDTDAFVHVIKGLLDEVVERMRALL